MEMIIKTLCLSRKSRFIEKNESNGCFYNKFAKEILRFKERLLQDMVTCQHKNQDIVCSMKFIGSFLKYNKVTY
jgi:hypothetical protein